MIRATILLFVTLPLIPVSIATQIYGWGLTPANWWAIAFGYGYMMVPSMIASLLEDD